MAEPAAAKRTAWEKLARRIRVPMGFVFAAFFLWLARPTWPSLGLSLAPVLAGLWLRGYAAGYVKKNAELTTTGPYGYTRNPLYLGSMLIAFGFGGAAGSWVLPLVLAALFAAIYIPTIRGEERYLRAHFPGFDAYAARVPRLVPRIASHSSQSASHAPMFSRERYLHHREYNASMGAGAIYLALVLRLLLLHPHH